MSENQKDLEENSPEEEESSKNTPSEDTKEENSEAPEKDQGKSEDDEPKEEKKADSEPDEEKIEAKEDVKKDSEPDSEDKANETVEDSSENKDPKAEVNCTDCGRPVSATTGKCYYCVDPEQHEHEGLKTLLMNWDSSWTEGEKEDTDSKKKMNSVMILLIIASSVIMGTYLNPQTRDLIPAEFDSFMPNLKNITAYMHFPLGIITFIAAFAVKSNSTGALFFCSFVSAGGCLFFNGMALKAVSHSQMQSVAIFGFTGFMYLGVIIIIFQSIFQKKAFSL